MLNRAFRLAEHQTTIARELQAGLTTFAAVAYVLAVNPEILAETGMDKAALVTVTALTAAICTAIMAFVTNYPIALAPGIGISSFFTYTLCIGRGVPWQEALGMVFVNGVLFLLLTITRIRERIIAAIPPTLKVATTCGIGLFVAFIGLKNGGVIVGHPDTLVAPGNFASPQVALCLGGIALTAMLVARRVPGAILLGILLVALAGTVVTIGNNRTVTELPRAFLSLPASPAPVFLELTFRFLTNSNAIMLSVPLILTLLVVDVFQNAGMIAHTNARARTPHDPHNLKNSGRALLTNSVATLLSALGGTSTAVNSIESAAGIEAGGRTGLAGVTFALLMLIALFLTPVILAIPATATAPALVIVGILAMQSITALDLRDFRVAAPAVLTILGIPLTFSIAQGIGLGLICAALLALAPGERQRMSPAGYVIALVFFLWFFKFWPFRM
jgi:adenine/guanine/hypoxanthine permease